MSKSNKSDDHTSTAPGDQFESSRKDDDSDEVYRDYSEKERTLLRSRAQLALGDVVKLLDHDDEEQRREIESAIEHLERIVDCMADEPLPCISAEVLEFADWTEYHELRYEHSVSGNMPMLLEAFVILVENEITPGRWILDPLAEAFGKILEDQDPEMVATRLGLQARGSGSASPLQGFTRHIEGRRINVEMKTLIEEFRLSKTNAANAVIEKLDLKLEPKTLVNRYESKTKFPDVVRRALDEHSAELKSFSRTWLSANGAEEFLSSFPLSAQKYLRKIRPAKT